MSTNVHRPDYETEIPSVQKLTKFGGSNQKAPPKAKYGGSPMADASKKHMAGFFKKVESTPEEDKIMKADKEAQETEQEQAVESTPEPRTEQEQEPQPQEATPEEGEPSQEGEGRRVPIGELYAERERRKELQARIAQLEATHQRVMEKISQRETPPPQPTPEIPAFESDPVANLAIRLQQLEQLSAGHNQTITQNQSLQQFQSALGGMENAFRTSTPDYDTAVAYAKSARDAELEALGYKDPAQRFEILRQEILGVAAYAMNNGQNPAETFYNYAKVRGYKPNSGERKPTASAVSPAQKYATVAKASMAARSPQGGVAPNTTPTLSDLAQMDDDEFDANFDKLWRGT